MAKPKDRPYFTYSTEAAQLLGLLIRDARISRRLTVAEAAERSCTSPGLVNRIEKGDMGCSLGAAFQLATLLGVRLFDAGPATLTRHLEMERGKLKLLPRRARKRQRPLNNDF